MNPTIPGVTYSDGLVWSATAAAFIARVRAALPASVPLHVTSVVRTAREQATVMLKKWAAAEAASTGGGNAELRAIYGRKAGAFVAVPRTVDAWEAVILELQRTGQGFTTGHLGGSAVDLRTRDLTSAQVGELVRAAQAAGGKTLVEQYPPHLHVDGFTAAPPKPAAPSTSGGGGGAGVLALLLLAGAAYAASRS